ncbi:MAG: methyltransferase protein [Gemmataceae bacterium]|nr:methyltransferase protein [Gemmataceae bacterium]
MPPRIHATPPEAVGETVRETVTVEGHTFRIDRPADPNRVFAHPAVRAAQAADEYLPHWVNLWPAARMLAGAIVREPWEAPLGVLEVGCGLGLAGIAALARGLTVTFSDVDETALQFAADNARLNGFADFRTVPVDIRCPSDDMKYPVVIGSDLIYQDRLVTPLVDLLGAVLAPGGVCLITDPDRPDRKRFQWQLQEAGFAMDADPVRLDDASREVATGTLYRIRFAARKTSW